MAQGGKRLGAGRPADAARTAERIVRLQGELQRGFLTSATVLSKNAAAMTQQAVELALGGDKAMLRFLLDAFFKVVGQLPAGEGATPFQAVHEEVLAIVRDYRANPSDRPTVVEADSSGSDEATGGGPDEGYGARLLEPITVEAGDGWREVR